MNSSFHSFAVAGAGRLGHHVIRSLVERNVSVVVLSRSAYPDYIPEGAATAKIEYSNVEGITQVLIDYQVDVLISTVGTDAYALGEGQLALADAAKQAGVQLFIPSEFGVSTVGSTEGSWGIKAKLIDHLEVLSIPYVRIFSGYFAELGLGLVAYDDGHKFHVIGKGETPISWTASSDVGVYIAHVLTTHPPAELYNRILRIQGDRVTLKDFAALRGDEIEYVDKLPGPGGPMLTWLQTLLDGGAGSTGWDPVEKKELEGEDAAGSGNALWPEYKWKTLVDLFAPSS